MLRIVYRLNNGVDGISDRTAEVAANAGAEVVVHTKNKGKGMAFKTGFEAVEDADIIVTMDSDGQHNLQIFRKSLLPFSKVKLIS